MITFCHTQYIMLLLLTIIIISNERGLWSHLVSISDLSLKHTTGFNKLN